VSASEYDERSLIPDMSNHVIRSTLYLTGADRAMIADKHAESEAPTKLRHNSTTFARRSFAEGELLCVTRQIYDLDPLANGRWTPKPETVILESAIECVPSGCSRRETGTRAVSKLIQFLIVADKNSSDGTQANVAFHRDGAIGNAAG
jgi:hypothetical protein